MATARPSVRTPAEDAGAPHTHVTKAYVAPPPTRRMGPLPSMGAICVLSAPRESRLASELRAALARDEGRGVDAHAWTRRYVRAGRCRPRAADMRVVDVSLHYRGERLIMLSGAADRHLAGSIAFPGGTLPLASLSVRTFAERDTIVLIQPPALSEFDTRITMRVPGDVAALDADITGCAQWSGITAPLIPLPGEWALGAALAIKTLRAWRERQPW